MTRQEFDEFCGSLTATTHVVQWGGASVWKVGGKIFAICSGWGQGDLPKFSFKCSNLAYSVLTDMPGIIPAPYLARAKWVQLETAEAMADAVLKQHIGAAYFIIVAKLTKAMRQELGLELPQA
jgi:predicted DNA-binding protein (MmcQ/YjbR family)